MNKFTRGAAVFVILTHIFILTACNSETDDRKGAFDNLIIENPMDMKGRTITFAYDSIQYLPEDAFILKDEILEEFSTKMAEKYNCKIEVKDISPNNIDIFSAMRAGKFVGDVVYNGYGFDRTLILPLDDYLDFNTEPFNTVEQNIILWQGKHYGVFIPVEYNLYNSLPKNQVFSNLLSYNKKF